MKNISHSQNGFGIANSDVCWITKAGVPNSYDGVGYTGKGSFCSDSTNGDMYVNTGTKAVPTWAKVTIGTALSAAKAITAYSFVALEPDVVGTIDAVNHTIKATVPNGTAVTALVATFTQTGASIKVGTTAQVSGTTANNFTNPVVYAVTAADGTVCNWTVIVTVAAA